MTGNLLGSLGLDTVEADPNAIPDGSYDGKVFASELVVVANKNTVNHVITYVVDAGEKKGARRQEWYALGNNPVQADGSPATKASDMVSFTPTMDETRKTWYKKRLLDLGIPEAEVATTPLDSIVGTPVTFNVKKENGYVNIKWVNQRKVAGGTTPTSLEDFTTPAESTSETAGSTEDPDF